MECFLLLFNATRNVQFYTEKQQQFPPAKFNIYFIFSPKVKSFKNLCSLPASLFPLKKIKIIESWDVHYTFKGEYPNNPLEFHEIFLCIQVGEKSNSTVAKQGVASCQREFLGVVFDSSKVILGLEMGFFPQCLDSWENRVLAAGAGFEIHWCGSEIFTPHGQDMRSMGFSIFPLVFWESSSVLPEPRGTLRAKLVALTRNKLRI